MISLKQIICTTSLMISLLFSNSIAVLAQTGNRADQNQVYLPLAASSSMVDANQGQITATNLLDPSLEVATSVEVSAALFEAIRLYQGYDPANDTLAEHLAETAPHLLDEWATEVTNAYPVQAILAYLAHDFSDVLVHWDSLGDHEPHSFIFFLMQGYPSAYATWSFHELSSQNLDLDSFMSTKHPDVIAYWQAAHPNPYADLSLLAFLEVQFPELLAEAKVVGLVDSDLGGPPPPPPGACTCKLIVSRFKNPAAHEGRTDARNQQTKRRNGDEKDILDVNYAANGAAQSARGYRYKWQGKTEYSDKKDLTHYTTLRTQILCDENCSRCAGQLRTRTEWGGTVYVKVDTAQIWAKASMGTAAVAAKLDYVLPVGSVLGFEKGVALAKTTEKSYDTSKFLNALESAIGLAFTSDPTKIADLTVKTVRNLLGLIKQTGAPGSDAKEALVVEDTSNRPITIETGPTYDITLKSDAAWHMKGWGGKNWTWFEYGSSYGMGVVASDFFCAPPKAPYTSVIPPQTTVLWSYADENGNISATTLKANLENYFAPYYTGLNLAKQDDQYP